MFIRSFDSTEEMVEAIRANAAHALAGLSPEQAALTWGDHWVQWVDLDAKPPVVEFGHIFTREEVTATELGRDAKVEDAIEILGRVEAHLLQGFMYGMAYSSYFPAGEAGTTHKLHVWPIEQRLFEMAGAENWDITGLDDTGRFLLNLAFQSHRLHWLAQQEKRVQS